ncbi:kinase-like domain-containing protein [Gigaspora rosea]|uniref:Kinase-like domain-containing protein n=1 Tax=Gigaspora rosea TaxID=44941 RepID=A0A397VGR9_9GLOM|nr:kinase-like domain-containing protein [Gigaspora rosea]
MTDEIEKCIEEKNINKFNYSEFESHEKIGGGSGIVNKSVWKKELVVLKYIMIRNDTDLEENTIVNFIRELQILQRVSFHPNIVQFYDLVGDYHMILKFAYDGNLRSYLKSKFLELQWDDKLRIAEEITIGLLYLHENGIIHRDLHSKNILIDQGKAMISDFGLSKQLDDTSLGTASMVHGLPAYIDPQCYKVTDASPTYKRCEKSDVYSLGVIFWEISSGRPPFESIRTREQVAIKIFQGERETPVENTPELYVTLYKRCWHEDPANRPETTSVLEKLRDIKPPSENLPPPSNIPFHTDLPARFSKMITIEHALEIASEISNSPCNVDHISERFKLLFSSTGKLDKDVFFSKCKNQEKTVIILKVEETEEIIGGYNPLAWKKLFFGGARYFETNESFIFSLKTKNLDYSLFSRVEDSKYAIYSQSGCGPSFGLYDLGMSKHDKEGRTWMCRKGSYEMQIRPIPGSFKIKECEVFQYLEI